MMGRGASGPRWAWSPTRQQPRPLQRRGEQGGAVEARITPDGPRLWRLEESRFHNRRFSPTLRTRPGPRKRCVRRPQRASAMFTQPAPRVSILLADAAQWEVMRHTAEILDQFGVAYESYVVQWNEILALAKYLSDAQSRGTAVVIAGSSGGVALAALCAAYTLLPVLGVPLAGPHLAGIDALLATVQAPPLNPVATLALGKAGAVNAALLAVAILANAQPNLRAQLEAYRAELAAKVLSQTLPP